MSIAPITIGEEVYIGAGSAILKGVTIGARATIGAGAVVTGDVAEGATVAGNPARSLEKAAPIRLTSYAAS